MRALSVYFVWDEGALYTGLLRECRWFQRDPSPLLQPPIP